MDTLHDTDWDVVISGTGLKQSLLALSLSRSDKKVLHIDENAYYGGKEAALSLKEAEEWTQQHVGAGGITTFNHASIQSYAEKELGSSRSYSLALAPHLIFTRSTILSALVSSRTHGQLEFQAVGSWFVADGEKLVKVPNGREDIFQDSTFDLRTKRALMKFIRHISDADNISDLSEDDKASSAPHYLENKFGLPAQAHAPILALTLSSRAPEQTIVETALPNIVRHLQSIGLFGPGFGALTPKWGGLAEIAQVACRAGAVGGGVYVLGRGIKDIRTSNGAINLTLSDDDNIKTSWLVGGAEDLKIDQVQATTWTRSISIIAEPLHILFPPTSEGGVTPAGAVINIPGNTPVEPPVYILVHSSDTGECPVGQCILYASVALSFELGIEYLQSAVHRFLASISIDDSKIIWSMRFQHSGFSPNAASTSEKVVAIGNAGYELALEDNVLEEVREIWHKITANDIDDFMRFGAREGADDDETIE